MTTEDEKRALEEKLRETYGIDVTLKGHEVQIHSSGALIATPSDVVETNYATVILTPEEQGKE